MKTAITLATAAETITVEPMGDGLRIAFKAGVFTFQRVLDKARAEAVLLAMTAALDAADTARERAARAA